MTPQEIKEAREHAQAALSYRPIHLKPATENEVMFARAVLALTEQSEPVSEDVLTTFLYDTALANLLDIDGDTPCVLAVELRRNYVITPKPETEDQADDAPDDPAQVDGALDRIAGHALAGLSHDQNGGAI